MSEPAKLPIQLTDFEQHIYDTHTSIRPSHEGDEYRFGKLWVDSGVQHFRVDTEFESDEHADWFRRALARALANIVIETKNQLSLTE